MSRFKLARALASIAISGYYEQDSPKLYKSRKQNKKPERRRRRMRRRKNYLIFTAIYIHFILG